jgi:hypothetical protein
MYVQNPSKFQTSLNSIRERCTSKTELSEKITDTGQHKPLGQFISFSFLKLGLDAQHTLHFARTTFDLSKLYEGRGKSLRVKSLAAILTFRLSFIILDELRGRGAVGTRQLPT